ncbi:methionyl-tRNA formyltransferase [Agriterribacter sp.]|uniref:methionyl-tRNA formyltransferase n=1 Tax=Agriterribacter sp. TaxID=2821509 RepID=UPI002B6CC6F3|nr:methionyl-tRNA formyltransferase [Agriterribacter sp.]HTN08198.1 methionyl-tRNA formyltransferase [Agriterribacter sp.]
MSAQQTVPPDKKGLRLVFMGTPEFAVASLDALVRAGYLIVAVVTAPDKPAGRGMKLTESAVKKYAAEKGLKILQPVKLKDPLFVEELRSLEPDIQIVVAFRMLPEIVWNMPPMGTVNVHGSLLPQYRGAAPINWAVINGEKETGVTTFKLQHEIDTGNILLQESFTIGDDETAGEVHDRMKTIGAELLVQTMEKLIDGTIQETAQQHPPLTTHHSPPPPPLNHAPKIFTETCRINWNRPVNEIYNLIRGLSPFPGAFTLLGEKTLKIFRVKKDMTTPLIPPGMYESDGKKLLRYAGKDGYIEILELQLEGKKRMPVEEFLRGYKF